MANALVGLTPYIIPGGAGICEKSRIEERVLTQEQYGTAYDQGFNFTIRLLISRGLQYDAAEEIAQAAWTRGWERLHQLRNENLVFFWTNTIALNLHRSSLHREPRKEGLPELPVQPNVNLAAIDVHRLLTRCRKEDRVILQSYYLDGDQTCEIAEARGISETAVRVQLMRARRAVYKRLEKPGLSSVRKFQWIGGCVR